MRKTQGVACPGLCAPLGLQPVLAKSVTSVVLLFVHVLPKATAIVVIVLLLAPLYGIIVIRFVRKHSTGVHQRVFSKDL